MNSNKSTFAGDEQHADQISLCPKCQVVLTVGMRVCSNCGYARECDRNAPGTPVLPHSGGEMSVNHMIMWMWGLTLLSMMLFSINFAFALILDLEAIWFAGKLIRCGEEVGKINGWIKAGLEIIGLIYGMQLGMHLV